MRAKACPPHILRAASIGEFAVRQVLITHASSESPEEWDHRGRPRNRGADQDHETGIERSGVRDQRSDRDRREGADNVSDAVEDADPGCDGARRSPPS